LALRGYCLRALRDPNATGGALGRAPRAPRLPRGTPAPAQRPTVHSQV
jgi:hypothetical protein